MGSEPGVALRMSCPRSPPAGSVCAWRKWCWERDAHSRGPDCDQTYRATQRRSSAAGAMLRQPLGEELVCVALRGDVLSAPSHPALVYQSPSS